MVERSKPASSVFSRQVLAAASRLGLTAKVLSEASTENVRSVELGLSGDTDQAVHQESLEKFSRAIRNAAEREGYVVTILRSTVEHNGMGAQLSILLESSQNWKNVTLSGNLDNYTQELRVQIEKELERKRRPKRKRSELPDPSKRHDAYVNRYPNTLTKQFKTDVTPELADRVEAFKKATGKTKREIVEEALEAYLSDRTPE